MLNWCKLISLTLTILTLLVSGCSLTPDPISDAEHRQKSQEMKELLVAFQAPVVGSISIDQAIARAVKYNLDSRVAVLAFALQNKCWDLSLWNMFPKIFARGNYKARNNRDLSTSHNIMTGRTTSPTSYSDHKENRTGDLGVSWNILDFGVSYYSAQQQADRSLVLKERQRKVAQKFANEVRIIFFKAVSGQQLESKIEGALQKANDLLEIGHDIGKGKRQSLENSLNFQKALLILIDRLERLQFNNAGIMSKLASLMNLPTGSNLILEVPGEMNVLPILKVETIKLE